MLHSSSEPVPLTSGYTPLFVRGSGYREHLVEPYVTGHDDPGLVSRRRADTVAPDRWPLSYGRAAEQLRCLRPGAGWSERKVEYRIEAVRRRLPGTGFPYPLMHDTSAGRPSDNSLLHNLLKGLVDPRRRSRRTWT
ncbi:hypothetical protein ACWEKM_15265 [Streptomyces sp. NPDC004752]